MALRSCRLKQTFLVLVTFILATQVLFIWQLNLQFSSKEQPLIPGNYGNTRLKMLKRCEEILTDECPGHLKLHHFRQAPKTAKLEAAEKSTEAILKSEIVLVVTFNRAENYVAATNVDMLYRNFFKEIYFCGPSDGNSELWPSTFRDDFEYLGTNEAGNFVDYGKHELAMGEMVYFCFNKVLDALIQNHKADNVRGIVFVPEDTIFNFWNIPGRRMDFDKSWMKSHHSIYDIDRLLRCPRPGENGEPSLCTAESNLGEMEWTWPKVYFDKIRSYYDSLENQTRFRDQYERLILATGGKRRVMALGTVDFFYIARPHFQLVYDCFSLMAQNHVYMEIAMATAFAIIEPRASFAGSKKTKHQQQVIVPDLRGHNSGAKRKSAPESYNSEYFYVHPFKLSRLNVLNANLSRDNVTFDKADACLFCTLLKFNFAR